MLCVCFILSRGRLIIMANGSADFAHTMLATEHYPYFDGAMTNDGLLEIHHSKISLHHAKAGYSYPTIRLPHTFSKLAGRPTRIYQTVHDGALAFLVVASPNKKTKQAQNSQSCRPVSCSASDVSTISLARISSSKCT